MQLLTANDFALQRNFSAVLIILQTREIYFILLLRDLVAFRRKAFVIETRDKICLKIT